MIKISKDMDDWEIKESQDLLNTPIGVFTATKKIDPSGMEREYISMQSPDWVCAIVYDLQSSSYLMVKQFRHGINKEVIEFPSGMVDQCESSLFALLRELSEEVGIKNDNISKIEKLYTACPNPAFMNNKMTCFFVEVNGYGDNNPDDDEFLVLTKVTAEEIESIVVECDYNVMMRFAWECAKKQNLIK